MASGKKNYFRHSMFARKDDKLMDLIVQHGKEAYFHFFVLLEMCATQAAEEFPKDNKFTFHRRTLCDEWMVTNSRLSHHLSAIGSSLGLHWVMTENKVEILAPNLRNFMGKYETKLSPNVSNKRKEKKKKEKEKESDVAFLIPDRIMRAVKMTEGYPEEIITQVSKEAWLIFIGNPDPEKNWERFLTHYLKNEKENIRNLLIEKSKNIQPEIKDTMREMLNEFANA